MTIGDFARSVASELSYTPNEQQSAVITALARFCSPMATADGRDRVFVLNGYAGTGKTSMTGALVRALGNAGVATVLLAPTGRAAKVFSAYAGHPAYTIHRRIYRHSLGGGTPGMQDNNSPNTIFIVDEASMISNDDEPSGTNLLRDLIHYVYAAPGCRMILLGDTAQLPPVGSENSPAMSVDVLHSYGLTVSRATLTATARQSARSGILANATWQRRAMRQDPMPEAQLFTTGFDDVQTVTGEDLPEIIDTCYNRDGIDDTIVVTRSNQRATLFNRAIRSEVLYREEMLTSGELLLVAKNNYHWSRGVKGLDFIANGDILRVERVHGTERRYGMLFADVTVALSDRPELSFDAKIMLETLNNDYAALPAPQLRALYDAILADDTLYEPNAPYEARLRALRSNPYWCALQVKYAYCVTCHKAQGGQWSNVIVDMGYIPPEAMGLEFYRWLYTATTRARQRLFFIS